MTACCCELPHGGATTATLTPVAEMIDVVVIGAGQAGLATSYHLTDAGVDHVVLERDRVGQAWRDRWDSFCLVIPNWTLQLPGYPYAGNDPDGFMPRDQIVSYLEGYAASIPAPVREGVEVTGIEPSDSGWTIRTADDVIRASAVVVASGAFQRGFRPAVSESLPDSVLQLDIAGYRNPGSLPPGKVLVVGSGQSGCQIAEELAEGGREVFLACGRAPWLPRRAGGRDMFWWLNESGFMDTPVTALSDPRERLGANPQLSGRDGGHDLNLRTLHEIGVTLLGHFKGANEHSASFAPDLDASVAFGDQAYQQISQLVREVAGEHGVSLDNELGDPWPWEVAAPESIELSGFGAAVFASGFRTAYRSWIDVEEAFDDLGFPIQDEEGTSVLSGLHFVGVHFLRKRKSALFPGVGEDASIVAQAIAKRLTR